MIKRILNKFVFPAKDHHNIAIALAQKPAQGPTR
jgi:hypothetical protein